MFDVEEEDWLEKFIEDYKAKLARERLELSTSARVKSQQACHEVEKERTVDDAICSIPSLGDAFKLKISPEEQVKPNDASFPVDQYPDLMMSIGRDERREVVDRKKKQEEYHRILDQQMAEHEQRKQKEKQSQLDVDDLENTTTSSQTNRLVRSPSPPIKSHYRNSVPVRVPSRPLSTNANQQRLSDLTELRQLYSNR